MTSSYVQPNHHKWHDINSVRQLYFFGGAVLHFALVCGSVPLLSGAPDSLLTVRQRSRKMAVIHFVPCHRQCSFSLLPITSRPDSASQQDPAPFRSGPNPPYSREAEVSGRPTSDSVSATRKHPRHSTPPPGNKMMAASQSVSLWKQRLVSSSNPICIISYRNSSIRLEKIL